MRFSRPRPLIRAMLVLMAMGGIMRAQAAEYPLAENYFPQLKGILEKALKQSPQMLMANINITQAQATYISTRSQMLPQLSGSMYYSASTSATADNPAGKSRNDGIYYGSSVSQPVFYWGTLKAQTDSARIGQQIAEKNYAEAYRSLAVSIRAQYLGLIARKIALRNTEFSLKITSDTLAVEEEKLRNGRISQGDIIGPRLALDEAKLDRDKLESDLTQAANYFRGMTGLESFTIEDIPTNLPMGVPDYNPTSIVSSLRAKFEQDGVEDTFQAQNLHGYIRQAELNYKVAKYRLYPKFSLNAGYSQNNVTNAATSVVSQTAVTSSSYSLVASWSIFDGFATKAAKMSAVATKRTYERQLADYLRNSSEQVRGMERAIGFAARAMQLSDTRRALMAENITRLTENLKRGVESQASLNNATVALYATELRATSNRMEYLNRWSEFVSATGIDPVLANLPSNYTHHGK